MPLTTNYLAELKKKGLNIPNAIIEVELDGGMKKYGQHAGGFSDVLPVLGAVTSRQNRLNTKKVLSEGGTVTFTIKGRDNFKTLMQTERLKGRRATVRTGFVAAGFQYGDYAESDFTGKISDWSRKGDDLVLTVTDDLGAELPNIPVENSTNTQYLDYQNTNGVDMLIDLLLNQLKLSGLLANTDLENWTAGASSAPDSWTLSGTGATIARDATNYQTGLYGAAITYGSAAAILSQSLSDYADYQDKQVTFGIKIKTSTGSQSRIRIDDGVGTTDSVYHSGGGGWEWVTVTRTIDASATKLEVQIRTEVAGVAYYDTAVLKLAPSVVPLDMAVNEASFIAGRDDWYQNWTVGRFLTKPQDANKYINELQSELGAYVYHDGTRISFKPFVPPLPGDPVATLSDETQIKPDSINCKSGYKDHFFNRILVYYNHDGSGSDGIDNFGAVYDTLDNDSIVQWDETKTKTIKCKSIKNYTYTPAANVTGVIITHISHDSPLGKGYLKFNQIDRTLQWRSSDGSDYGESITITTTAKYDIKGVDEHHFIRVIVDVSSLPGTDQTDEITISLLPGDTLARVRGDYELRRYGVPVSLVDFTMDLNDLPQSGVFLNITDIVDLTTDEAFEFGDSTWVSERNMIIGLRPDHGEGTVKVELEETKFYSNRYGVIAPASQTGDYDAGGVDHDYAFVSDSNGFVGAANAEGYLIC